MTPKIVLIICSAIYLTFCVALLSFADKKKPVQRAPLSYSLVLDPSKIYSLRFQPQPDSTVLLEISIEDELPHVGP